MTDQTPATDLVAEARPESRRRRLPHPISVVTFSVVTVIMLVTALVIRTVVHDQEERLLDERSSEVAAFLTGSATSIRSSLLVLGSAASTSGGLSSTDFAATTKPLFTGAAKFIGTTSEQGGTFKVINASGDGPAAGSPLDDARAALARKALGANGNLVSTVVKSTEGSRLTFGTTVGGGRTVVLYETMLNPAQPQPSSANSPYRELDADLYAATTADPNALLLTTRASGEGMGHGRSQPLPVGAETWLLVTSSRQPLVGSVASKLPWIVFVAGLLIATLVASLVDVLVRRRRYAMDLVAARTAALRAAQEQAETANQSKSEFLSRMSHELRTPLNAVLGFGQLLELDDLTAPQRESVNQIMRGGSHLLDLINEVLDISHIEAGRLSLSPEPVLVSELLSDVLHLVRPLAADRSVNLVGNSGAMCEVFMFADRQRIKQILLNLLSNAIKYNRPRGTVALSCGPSGESKLRISVVDTGPGIPEHKLDQLFTPFERLGAEATDVEGTGIGLALSRRLAEAMGGTLGVESAHGRGSTFWVELPLVEGQVERYERLDLRAAERAGAHIDHVATRRAILHIEDNLSNLRLVERILGGRDDIEVIAAMQGRLGLEMAREHHPALILLDVHLPDVDGDEVLQRLRQDPETSSIPVVMVSADATPRQVQRLLAAGATAYLTKPINVQELLRLLNDALVAT